MDNAYQLNNVRFHYADRQVLDIESLHIKSGTVTALVGPNGSGKTTLLKLLSLVEQPSHGQITLFNKLIENVNLVSSRKRVGLVQQNPYLLRGSVRKNVELGLRLQGCDKHQRITRADAAMQRLAIDKLADRNVRQVSGGEAQRIAIARTLVLQPEVLLLDEPFTHLDKGFHKEIESMVDGLAHNEQRTIIFSSHDRLRSQLIADEVFSVVEGRVIKSSLVNLYRGNVDTASALFDTGKLQIALPSTKSIGTHLAIEPAQIVLSHSYLDSSMRNAFEGRIVGLVEENGQVRVTIQAGEQFEVLVTHGSAESQQLNLGKKVWLSFKSSAVQVF